MSTRYKFNNKLQKPSILEGVSKMADLRSLKEKYAELFDENADYQAIFSDWLAVGQDFQKSIDAAVNELPETS